MKQKIAEFSFLHVFAILLVVIGHSFFQMESPIVDWIYQFHVPLFFFVSGYLFNVSVKGKQINPHIFLRHKAVRLLLPYFALSTLLFVPKVLLSQYMVRPIQANWSEYVLMLIYPYRNVNSSYWFLPTLFLLFVFAVVAILFFQRLKHRTSLTVTTLLLTLLALANISLPFSHDTLFNVVGVIHYAFYFALGYFVSSFGLMRFLDKRKTSFLVFLFTFVVSIFALYVNKSPLMDLFLAMNGILMSVALARLYAKYEFHFLNHLSPSSYTIYLYHGIFQALSLQILMRFTHFDNVVYIILAFLTGVYGSFLVYKLLYGYRNSRLGRILALISGVSTS
ncbi:acyltransferase family protein [Prevotella melaninogenica]|uniref:O-acetyltransferase n=1 Tax=Prevotella melaninogenica TaxID=28132 RepID=A0A250KEX5_9BACT|nr:acyltransferase [Prevotella melaninogenica]BBA28141.1 O-acetyltransferase [Prevotella melaninogenica]